jgi:phospholipid/cholesterol/gamma-HCH transport system substrate-binding protein
MKKIPTRRISSPFLIGLFLLMGITITLVAVFWLSRTQFMEESKYYLTYFEGSVEGLETGSPVKYLGVKVGTIKTITVAPDGKLIEILMQLDKKIVIVDSLRVKSEMAGIAGGRFLQLHFPSTPEYQGMYPKLTFKPPFPVIKSSPSGLEEIELAAREVLNNFRMLEVKKIQEGTLGFLNEATRFFSSDSLYAILNNIEKSSETLDRILSKADSSQIIDNLTNTSMKLMQTSNQLKRFSDSLNAEIEKLNLEKRLDNVVGSYDTTLSNARNVMNNIGFRTENILFTVNQTLEEVKATNRQLRKTLRSLSDNPSQILFSEPPPEEK